MPLTGGLDLVPDLTFAGLDRLLGARAADVVVVDVILPDWSCLRDRLALGEECVITVITVITVVAIIDTDTGRLTEEPDYIAHGFEHDGSTFRPATSAIEKALAGATERGVADLEELERLIGREVQMWAQRAYRRRPVVIPVVVEA